MKNGEKQKIDFREIVKFFSTAISWTIFVLLLICAFFLIYYFIATQIYIKKGSGHEPKYSLYTIISPSMVPNINVYDVIIDVKVDKPEDIKINDVITFNSSIPGVNGGTITHRVIAINRDNEGNYYYQTKGDNNLVEDGVNVSFDSVVGKVALRIPKLGKVQSLLASKAGYFILILIPALYIIISGILKRLKAKFKDSDNRFIKFLNRPVIGYKKPKLLTYTPNDTSTNTISEPNLSEEPKPIPSFMDEDDEDDIDLDDLPKLK